MRRHQNAEVATVDHDPFAGPLLDKVIPTTEAQREIWLADQLGASASLAFNEAISLRLLGPLRVPALSQAMNELVARHESLRATVSADGMALLIGSADSMVLETIEVPAADESAREAFVARQLAGVVEHPFDLVSGPLIRARLLVLGSEDHMLLLSAHHIVCDGWSFGVIARDIAALYRHACEGASGELASALQFSGYAAGEAEREGSQGFIADERYWLSRLDGEVPILDLPTDRTRPATRGFGSRRYDHELDAALVGNLKRLGGRNGASVFALLLGAFSVLMARVSGQREIVVGVPTAGQLSAEMPSLVGHCVNLLPIRIQVDPDAAGLAALARVQSDLLEAFEHQRYTFGTLLRKLQLPRDPGRMPLVNIMFNLDRALDGDSLGFPGLQVELRSVPRHFENFELFVNATQVGGAVRLECQYNTDLFDPATVANWMSAYEAVLRGLLEAPGAPVGTLPVLSAGQFAQLEAWNATAADYDRGALVHDLVRGQAERTPQATAVVAGRARLTYAELMARAGRISNALRARGVKRGHLVGLCVERGIDMLAAMLGILESGAAYVPLDPRFPHERLSFMAQDAKLALLVTESAVSHRLAWPADRSLQLDTEAAWIASCAAQGPTTAQASPADAAYVIYTSGSTGTPKGVAVPHSAVVNFLTSMRVRPGLKAGDGLVAVTTLSFDIAVLELLLPLVVGARVIMASREQALDGSALRELLESSGATAMQATPATWRMLLEGGWSGTPGLKVLVGGEALLSELAARLLDRSAEVWNMYGPTEATVWSTCWRVQEPGAGIMIGTPIGNTWIRILDDQGQECPIGSVGELCIGGDGVAIGYLKRPELTAERFAAKGQGRLPAGRLYRTGDRGRWRHDGLLEHKGRLDSQVKVRGFRIELGEVESALRTFAGVTDVVAVVREDRPGDAKLVAYLVSRDGAGLERGALSAHLKISLPDYMLPQHYVVLDALPRLPNGKIDRHALPAPVRIVQQSGDPDAPRSELERVVCAVMQSVLGLPDLNLHDDFFALGGHSLMATQVTARLNRDLGVRLTLRALFEAPTIAALARLVEAELRQNKRAVEEPIGPRADPSVAPLSLVQQRLWFLEKLNPGRTVYNTPSAHRLRGRLDEAALQRAFQLVVDRHEVLRTSIDTVDGDAIQRIQPRLEIALFPAEDLSAIGAEEREAALLARLDALVTTPFDLRKAPLFVVRMFRLGPEDHVLFFMPHHIVWDGWSFDLFYEEMANAYLTFLEGKQPALEPLAVSYGDFAAWQQRWLHSADFEDQAGYWRKRLQEAGATRELMTDFGRKPGMSGSGGTEWIAIPRQLTDQLRSLGQETDATLFMTLLSAYCVLLTSVGADGQETIGVPVRGRSQAETEPMMGYFTNLLPISIAVDPAESFVALLARVRKALLEAFTYPDVPLERLMDSRSGAGRGGSLYQALFSFQDARRRPMDWGNVRHERLEVAQPGATEDFGLWLVEQRGGLVGGLTYNADLYRPETVRRLRENYVAIINRVLVNPEVVVGSLVALSDEEQARLQAWMARNESLAAPLTLAAPASSIQFASENERALADIWQSLLGLPSVQRDDNFFELGGHSLLVMQAVETMERRVGRRVDARRYIFETLAQIAQGYEEAEPLPQKRTGLVRRLLGGLRKS